MSFVRFLVRRIITGIVVLWIVSGAAFLLFFPQPRNTVARELAGRAATPETLIQVNKQLGLSQPILVQYGHYLDRLLHGNLGYSFLNGESVNTILAQDLPRTASVVVGGVVLWLIVGLSVGILSATRARGVFDRIATVGVLAGLSMPTFVLGELLLFFVFLQLSKHGFTWIQNGYEGPSQSITGWVGLCRLLRGETLRQAERPYVTAARSLGQGNWKIIVHHLLPNVMPIIETFLVRNGLIVEIRPYYFDTAAIGARRRK